MELDESTKKLLENIRRILRDEMRKHGAKKSKLSEAISLANPTLKSDDGPKVFDRRKILEFLPDAPDEANGDKDISLRLTQITALHNYLLQSSGRGFDSVFRTPYLLDSAAQQGHVVILVGSKPVIEKPGAATAVIIWDFRAATELAQALHEVKPNVYTQIEEVVLNQSEHSNRSKTNQPSDLWRNYLNLPNGPSIISIGSPRANRASEYLLSHMYGIEPFQPNPDNELSFGFYWYPPSPTPSSFDIPLAELHEYRGDLKEPVGEKERLSAILMRDWNRVYEINHEEKKEWFTYALITAQRQRSGALYVCVNGLEGPATLAAARSLSKLERLAPYPDQKPKVLEILLRVSVRSEKSDGDSRVISSWQVISELQKNDPD